MEPSYWRNRLQELDLTRHSTLFMPRHDLSGSGKNVVEFQTRSYDGTRLWGLFARPVWTPGPHAARIRTVGPSERPEVDPSVVCSGTAEFVFQEPAGRRLEDRVLDALRICKVAVVAEDVDPTQVSFACPTDEKEPDEFLIAQQLFDGKFC